jgi:hypothetical protein
MVTYYRHIQDSGFPFCGALTKVSLIATKGLLSTSQNSPIQKLDNSCHVWMCHTLIYCPSVDPLICATYYVNCNVFIGICGISSTINS